MTAPPLGQISDLLTKAGAESVRLPTGLPLDVELRQLAEIPLGQDGGLGPELRQTRSLWPKMNAVIDRAVDLVDTPPRLRLSLAAGLKLMFEFWDESHEAAQQADDQGESRFAPYWHGIAHRREPDPGNAAYWFRRVGTHPLYPELRRKAASIAGVDDSGRLVQRLLDSKTWSPQAFIDLCTQAGTKEERSIARRVQAAEMRLLFDATLQSALGSQ